MKFSLYLLTVCYLYRSKHHVNVKRESKESLCLKPVLRGPTNPTPRVHRGTAGHGAWAATATPQVGTTMMGKQPNADSASRAGRACFRHAIAPAPPSTFIGIAWYGTQKPQQKDTKAHTHTRTHEEKEERREI